ncbi:MAG: coenzyme F420-0:L-glutamate ligase [Alphaproteobacteria bacterium]|nr:coenzyme F420-0:L-glutamate ligase [Alphaproteobacteria bacterium]
MTQKPVQLNFIPIKTRIVQPPKDEIWDILDALELSDGDIVFITSKILGIHQGRCVPVDSVDKQKLIEQEATHWLSYDHPWGHNINLTITDNILISAAGIDESNADGHYIMWPKNVDKLCHDIRAHLMKKNNLTNLGVVSTDSYTTPLRFGVAGITIGLSGVKPLKYILGSPDIFGRKLQVVRWANIIDPLTSLAVMLMGEAAEQTPIIILRGYKDLEFADDANMDDFKIPPEVDIYQPLLSVMESKK